MGNIIYSHSSSVLSVSFSHDDSKIVSGSKDGTIKLWDTKTGGLIQALIGHNVSSLAFSSDDTKVVSCNLDYTINVLDISLSGISKVFYKYFSCAISEKVVPYIIGHSSTVTSIATSYDGAKIVSGSSDATIKVWDACTGDLIHTFIGHSDAVYIYVYISTRTSKLECSESRFWR